MKLAGHLQQTEAVWGVRKALFELTFEGKHWKRYLLGAVEFFFQENNSLAFSLNGKNKKSLDIIDFHISEFI